MAFDGWGAMAVGIYGNCTGGEHGRETLAFGGDGVIGL